MSFQISKFECKPSVKGVDTDLVAVFQAGSKSKSDPKLIVPKGSYAKVVKKLEQDELFKGAAGSEHLVTYGGQDGSKSVVFLGKVLLKR